MAPSRNQVIDAHPDLIDPLRKSEKCKKKALMVVQYVFATKPKKLHPMTMLSGVAHADEVTYLSRENYDPQRTDRTALYHTLYFALREMSTNVDACLKQGIFSTFTIAVITDGKDNIGVTRPEEIHQALKEYEAKEYLRKSVIIGFESKIKGHEFTRSDLEEIKSTLGFQCAIFIEKEGPDLDAEQRSREIRRAFALASESAMSGQ
jgi:hypothetical protein